MHHIQFRRLLKTDIDSFMNLRLAALQNSPLHFLSTYEEEKISGRQFFEKILSQEDEKNAIFGAFNNHKLICLVGIYQEIKMKTKHKCTIWGVYISPDFRGQGIAKLLMQTAISHAKDNMKCAVITLSTGVQNSQAKKLYQSFGFKTWGIEPDAFFMDGKFYDEEHMMLKVH